MKPAFSRVNARGTRAVCPQPDCGTDFSVSIQEEFSYCHRCRKHWPHTESNYVEEKPPELKNTRTPLYIRGNKAREQAGYDEARSNFIEHFDLIVKHEQLPWPDAAKEFEIGAKNKGQDDIQLIFEIDEDHYKLHKGQQFGNADCKIFPLSVLLVVEGEKDVITANSNGAPAITFTSGAGALPQDIAAIKQFTKIVICYDNDQKGKEGADKVAMALYKQSKKRKIKILKWSNKPDKYDLTDYYRDGFTTNDLYSLIDKMPVYGSKASDFGGLNAYDPVSFVNRFQDEVVQICEEILLENGTSSISGQSNVGKSILALQFAMSVAMGVPFLTFNVPRPRKVLLVQFEMMDAHMKTRVDKCMAGMMANYPHKISLLRDNLKITSMENIKIFTDQYKAIEGNLMSGDFDVCVVDNLYSSSGTQLHKNDALTQLMSRIDELRKEYQCAFMMISHHKKLEEKRPLEHSMVYGGSYFVNFLDNLVQVANTGRHNQLKVFKITKIRTENEFHEVPLGIWLHAEDDQLYFQYRKPLPKNEAYWYTDPEENTEERVLKAMEIEGDNFSYIQFADALEKTLKITSMKSVYKWLDKLENMGYITKIERGHYVRCANELDSFIN